MKKKKVYSIDDHFTFEKTADLRAQDGVYILKGRLYKCNYCPCSVLEKYCKEHYQYLHGGKKPKYKATRVNFDMGDD